MAEAELNCGTLVTRKDLVDKLRRECLRLARQPQTDRHFPGSQPVSFERKHLSTVQKKPYYACEKTDGVRFMLLASEDGAYLVDRNFELRRVRVNLPNRDNPAHQVTGTLVDGELVQDVCKDTGRRRLRYLIYDAVSVLHRHLLKEALPMRLLHVKKELLVPRARLVGMDFTQEPFSLELKEFYTVRDVAYVFNDVIPGLKHENDGIIFTPVPDHYVRGTCDALLKWKPAHMNTVDFRLIIEWRQRQPRYQIQMARGAMNVFAGWLDPPEPDPEVDDEETLEKKRRQCRDLQTLNGKIIECSFDHDWHTTTYEPGRDWSNGMRYKGGWRYERPREDKNTPNDEGVVHKVMKSIKDNVSEEELVNALVGDGHRPGDGFLAPAETSEAVTAAAPASHGGEAPAAAAPG